MAEPPALLPLAAFFRRGTLSRKSAVVLISSRTELFEGLVSVDNERAIVFKIYS
jgi:hypothetical protein